MRAHTYTHTHIHPHTNTYKTHTRTCTHTHIMYTHEALTEICNFILNLSNKLRSNLSSRTIFQTLVDIYIMTRRISNAYFILYIPRRRPLPPRENKTFSYCREREISDKNEEKNRNFEISYLKVCTEMFQQHTLSHKSLLVSEWGDFSKCSTKW